MHLECLDVVGELQVGEDGELGGACETDEQLGSGDRAQPSCEGDPERDDDRRRDQQVRQVRSPAPIRGVKQSYLARLVQVGRGGERRPDEVELAEDVGRSDHEEQRHQDSEPRQEDAVSKEMSPGPQEAHSGVHGDGGAGEHDTHSVGPDRQRQQHAREAEPSRTPSVPARHREASDGSSYVGDHGRVRVVGPPGGDDDGRTEQGDDSQRAGGDAIEPPEQ